MVERNHYIQWVMCKPKDYFFQANGIIRFGGLNLFS